MSAWLLASEVSRRYEIPMRTVQAACRDGRLPSQKLGRFYVVLEDDAATFAQSRGYCIRCGMAWPDGHLCTRPAN